MVTIVKKLTGGAYPFYEYACLSTDTKPASLVPENSICHEIDTGKHFYFGNGEWKELPPKGGSGGGSGGGGSYTLPTASASTKGGVKIGSGLSMDGDVLSATGGAGKFTVTFTEQNGEITADGVTIAEIIEAKEAGDIVVGVYTSFGLPCEIPCVAALEVQIEGQAFPVAVFAGPIAGEGIKIATISGIPDGGSDEWSIELSDISSSVSYNDLDDKPFYEETVSPAMIYTIPYTDGSNPDKSYQIPFAGDTAYAYLYRVGDALTASQLEGATVNWVSSTQSGDETSTLAITSNNITEVTNGRYVMSDGFPLVFVADIDGVDIDIQDPTNFKSLEAGTYLVYIDADSVQSGARLYTASLSKAAVTTVYKLNAKFYDSYAPLIVTMYEDKSVSGQFNGDKTYQEVYESFRAGKNVLFELTIDGEANTGSVLSAVDDGKKYIIHWALGRSIVNVEGASGSIVFVNE